MADSYTDFGVVGDLEGDQLNGIFGPLTIDYISTAHFTAVHTDTVTGAETTIANADLTVATTPNLAITLLASGISLPLDAADTVRIIRTTPITELQRTFSDGSVLKAGDLNTQTKQLLFGIQEQVDLGVGSMPIGVDGKFDAGSRVIKGVVSGTNEDELVNKAYIDNASLYGGAYGAIDPQFWTFTTSDDDEVGTDRVFALSSPYPAGDSDSMYLVEVGGVLQNPGDYNVTQLTTTSWTLTLLQASAAGSAPIADGVVLHARNFGAVRNVVSMPFVAESDDSVGFIIRGYSASQTSNLMEVQEHDGTVRMSVDEEGGIRVYDGAGTSAVNNAMIRATDAQIEIECGSYGSGGGSPGALLKIGDGGTADYGRLRLSNHSDSGAGNPAIVIASNRADPVYCFTVSNEGGIYGLNLTTKNDAAVGGNLTVTGQTYCDDINGSGYIEVGGGKDAGGATIETDGDFTTSGNILGGDEKYIQSKGEIRARGGSTNGLVSSNLSSYPGQLYFSSSSSFGKGPVLRDWSGSVAGPAIRLTAGGTNSDRDGSHIWVSQNDGSTPIQIRNVADPTSAQHVATKAYVDSGIDALVSSVLANASTSGTAIGRMKVKTIDPVHSGSTTDTVGSVVGSTGDADDVWIVLCHPRGSGPPKIFTGTTATELPSAMDGYGYSIYVMKIRDS